jgi:hypothetical protein
LCHCLEVLLARVALCVSRSTPAAGGLRVILLRHSCEEVAYIVPLSLQVLLTGVPLRVSRSRPTVGGRRVSLTRHRCKELPNIVPVSAGVASWYATPCVTVLPGSWWPQGEPANGRGARSWLTLCHCLQVSLAGVPLRVSRSYPTAGGRRVSLPRHRC